MPDMAMPKRAEGKWVREADSMNSRLGSAISKMLELCLLSLYPAHEMSQRDSYVCSYSDFVFCSSLENFEYRIEIILALLIKER